MNQPKHSPTPWKVGKNKYGLTIILDASGEDIARLDGDEDNEKNAKAIVFLANNYPYAMPGIDNMPWTTEPEVGGCRSLFNSKGTDIGFVSGFDWETGPDGDALFMVMLTKMAGKI